MRQCGRRNIVSKTYTISDVNLDLQIAMENALSIVVSITVTRFATADSADRLAALSGNIRRTVIAQVWVVCLLLFVYSPSGLQ